MEDWCPLCGCPMSKHFVHTESVVLNGKKGLKPTGWDCPDISQRDQPIVPLEMITTSPPDTLSVIKKNRRASDVDSRLSSL